MAICCDDQIVSESTEEILFSTTEGIDTNPAGKITIENFIANDQAGCLSGIDLTLPDGSLLPDGRHCAKVLIVNCGTTIAEDEACFNIDTSCPVIKVISPTNDSIATEIPTLEYTVTDLTGIQRVEVFIDGTNYGYLPSGTALDFLDFGEHKILITAEDIATKGGQAFQGFSGYGYGYGDGLDGYADQYGPGKFQGNTCSVLVQFTLCKPICVDASKQRKSNELDDKDKFLYIGSDSFGLRQADAAFEEFRILNKASTCEDLLNDFKLMKKRVRYQNREVGGPLLDDQLRAELLAEQIDCGRISRQIETLLLAHFDNNLQLAKGINNVGVAFTDKNGDTVVLDGPDLSRSEKFLIEKRSASNDVDVTVFFPEGETIDQQLLTETIKRVIPAHAQAFIKFIPQETEQLACDRVVSSSCDDAA